MRKFGRGMAHSRLVQAQQCKCEWNSSPAINALQGIQPAQVPLLHVPHALPMQLALPMPLALLVPPLLPPLSPLVMVVKYNQVKPSKAHRSLSHAKTRLQLQQSRIQPSQARQSPQQVRAMRGFLPDLFVFFIFCISAIEL